ncbi:MAG: SCO family protein [Anaerolineaceae bacterium]
MSKGLWLGLGLLGGVMLVAALTFFRPYQLKGSAIDPPNPAPEIVLSSTHGGDYRLSAQKGKLVLIFFGFTSCPDVCPLTISDMRQLRNRLAHRAENVDLVIITVDPARDTLERMANYLGAFDAAIIGLTGSEAELEAVWASYGVWREIDPGATAAGYLVNHSTRMYLIDRNNRLRATYAFGTPVADIEADLRYLMNERVQ